MLIEKIICNITELKNTAPLELDFIDVEWYEVGKKILHKVSEKGMDVGIRLNEATHLHYGDVLWLEGSKVLAVRIPDCECIAFKPQTMLEMGKACYEMGNRHAPMFINEDELLTPYDEPLYNSLLKAGFKVEKKSAKLIKSLGGHGHGHAHTH